MLVELEDGSLANIEIQKIGYAFPGQRVACYSADTLLRQYKRVRGERKKKFTYRDIKTVYTIVFFEKSTQEFHLIKEHYIHKSKQVFDTKLELETLQEYVLIPLDIYKENMQNKIIDNELDAWFAFMAYDEPGQIVRLIEAYPKFRDMYEEIYDICRNIERVMQMYSKELAELDRNTVQYMIEEQEKVIKEQAEELERKSGEISQKEQQIVRKELLLNEKAEEIAELRRKLEELSGK